MPVITLISDFGWSDHYAGAMKGVILSVCAEARIVDISHGITPYEIAEAAFALAQSWRYFPAKTVHIIVVDPGVGSERRAIAASAGGHYFVAPDNGVLSMVFTEPGARVRAIESVKLFRHPVSQTFHGRDIFASVAAHLAAGVSFAKLGPVIDDYARLSITHPVRTARRGWTGAVLKIDRFGNLITNFPMADFAQIEKQPFDMSIGLRVIDKLAKNYAEMRFGEPFVIAGSSGFLEVSVNQGSAAKVLGVGVGAPIELRLL